MKKRIISAFLLVFVAVVALIPAISFNASAAEETYTLVTDASKLKAGDKIVIVAKDYNYALSTTQNGNNRGQAQVTKGANNTLTLGSGVQVITLEAGNTSGSFAFKVDDGYLYSASSSKNYLRTESTLSNNSSWKITIDSSTGKATIKSQGANTRNTIYYNNSSSIFSSYNSAQKDVCIYKLEDVCTHTGNTTIKDSATCTEGGEKVTVCDDCKKEISRETSPAKGHTPGAEADCENAQTCTVCLYVVTEALGHNYADGSCTVCGQADPNACAHTNKTTTDSATCTEDGEKVTVCDDCEKEISRETSPAKGHTPGAEADCTNAQTCTVCGDVVTEALGHNHVDGVCTECGDKLPVASFVVPEGATAPGNTFGPSFTAPGAPELPDVNYDHDYTFAGWATETQSGSSVKPTLYAPGETVAIGADTTFYAVYTYIETGKTHVSGYIKTELDDIQSTDVVVITMAKGGVIYALTSANGASSAPTAVKVTVNGDQLSGDIADALLWNISNNAGTLTIYVNGSTSTWLYCTSANNGVRVGNGDAKTFTIDKDYLMNAGTGDNRYIGVYNSADWRCYKLNNGSIQSNISGQTLAFYVYTNKEVTTEVSYYTTTLATSECEHNYVPEVTEDATCTDDGIMTYTCSECGNAYTETIEATGHSYTEYTSNGDATCTEDGTKTATCDNGCGSESTVKDEGSATGHNYEDNYCTVCGHFDINNVDISGRYYIAAKRTEGNYWFITGVLTDSSTKRYVAFDSGLTELPTSIAGGDTDKIFVIVKNDDGTYSIYAEGIDGDNNYLGWTSGNSGAFVNEGAKKNFALTINNDGTYSFSFDDRYLSLNGTKDNDYFAFYTGTQKHNLSLIPVVEEVTPEPQAPEFSGASLNIGQDLSIRYHVIPGDGTVLGDYTVRFTMNGKEVIVSGVEEGGKFVFSFTGIAPQCMSDVIKAELLLNGEVVDVIEEYSVAIYAADALELYSANAELSTLIVDLLYYGEAAQNYTGYNTENLATSVLSDEQKAMASAFAPEDADNKKNVNVVDNSVATFTAAGVNFDYNNRIYVKFTATDIDNVKVLIGGAELEIISLGGNKYMAYSERISALEFSTEVVFTLTVGEETAATLTYTINDYAYTMNGDAEIGELALALYRYGMSAVKYDITK